MLFVQFARLLALLFPWMGWGGTQIGYGSSRHQRKCLDMAVPQMRGVLRLCRRG